MRTHVIGWDLETVPDLRSFTAANELGGKSDDEIREARGDKSPKHIYHSIACIGAAIAHCDDDCWVVDALGVPRVGEWTGKELITSFGPEKPGQVSFYVPPTRGCRPTTPSSARR
jgi:hypothetical protein